MEEDPSPTRGAEPTSLSTSREDPSRLTKLEVRNRATDCVAAAGDFARLSARSAASAPLQSAITAFTACEKTVASTHEMLQKINAGMIDLEEGLDEVASALSNAVADRSRDSAA